jgi:hypothetical protein
VRRALRSAAGGLLILIGICRPLGAQHRSSVDVGVSVVRFLDDTITIAGPSVGVSSAVDGRRLFGQVDLGGVGTPGSASGSATLVGGARAPLAPRLVLEGSAELFGVAGTSVRSAVAATGTGRAIWRASTGGAWVSGATSVARREAGSLPAQALAAGAWWSWPRARVSAMVVDQRARGQLFSGPLRSLLIGTIPVRYREGTIAARIEGNAASLELAAGLRHDPDAASAYEPTFALTAAVWQSERQAWTLTLARQPPDWVRGADAAQWIALGMRFYEPRPSSVRAARVRPVVSIAAGDTGRVVRVRAPGARTVEVMADFTDWAPVTLPPVGDLFERTMDVSAGTHRLVVRVDGGPWRPAVNTPAVNDDLGGRVGLIVVP